MNGRNNNNIKLATTRGRLLHSRNTDETGRNGNSTYNKQNKKNIQKDLQEDAEIEGNWASFLIWSIGLMILISSWLGAISGLLNMGYFASWSMVEGGFYLISLTVFSLVLMAFAETRMRRKA